MLKRLYIHNFRCLENFEFDLEARSSALLLGRNGSGKTTLGLAIEILRKIARGTNRVSDLLRPKDVTKGRLREDVRFSCEVEIKGMAYYYELVFEYPENFRELRVKQENLLLNGSPVYTREYSQMKLLRSGPISSAAFLLDWHLVGLPIVQVRNNEDPIHIFRAWLGSVIILKPVPSLFSGEADQSINDRFSPDKGAINIGQWFSSILFTEPNAYSEIGNFLKAVLVDFDKISTESVGRDVRSLVFHFNNGTVSNEMSLDELSDGEKCFVVFALTIAANSAFGPLLCFWDEPDNFLAADEVGHSVISLRKALRGGSQLIVTSHNSEVVSKFGDTDTFYLSRAGHLDPTRITTVEAMRNEKKFEGGVVDALLRGELKP